MIEEGAWVITCREGIAEVEGCRLPACGTCEGSPTCGTASLAGYFGRRPVRMRALNPIGAQPGERVVVGLAGRRLAITAGIFYGAPLLGWLGGAGVLELVLKSWPGVVPEWATLVGAGLGLATALYGVRLFGRSGPEEKPTILVLRRDLSLSSPGPSQTPPTDRDSGFLLNHSSR